MENPAPLKLDEALSPQWLSAALSAAGKPVRVTAVRVVETIKTMATKVRFQVDFADDAPGPNHAFCIKGFFNEIPLPANMAVNARSEAHFYLDIKPHLGIEAPLCRYAGIDAATGHGVALMDDIVAGGGRFLTALEPYSAETAKRSLEQIARMHAETWRSERLNQPWLVSRFNQMAETPYLPDELLRELLSGERGLPLAAEIKDVDRIHRGLKLVASINAAQPQCLVHGDAHAGNLYALDGKVGLIDWQVLQHGGWALDVAYHIGSVLSVEDRRKSERDLLLFYLDRLAAGGVIPPTWDEAWFLYRTHILYGYYFWAITRRVDPPIILEFTKRLGLAVTDLETFDLLERQA